MTHILVGFSTRRRGALAWLTRFFGRWRHSHVVLIHEAEDILIEATDQGGVREMPITYLLSRDDVEVRKIPHPFPHLVWEFAALQKGKPYDEGYSWGWLFRRDWQNPDQWSCTELIAWAAAQAGKTLFPPGTGYISVRDLYLISEAY